MDDLDNDEIIVETGYEPRPLQYEIHQAIKRFSVLAIHRRFGKTVCALNHGLDYGLKVTLPNPQVSFISPFYKQSKNVAWAYLKDAVYQIPNVKTYESELKAVIPLGMINGKPNVFTFQLFGADNPDSLRGMYHDYCIFDEFGNQPISIWTEVCSPAIADRKGGALFLGTPNGKNHFYKLYMQALEEMKGGSTDWYAATYSAEDTNVIDPEELAAQRNNMPEEEYAQEFLCDWSAAIRGAYYAANMVRARREGRILRIPYESGLPVFTAWDLGVDDYTACWFFQCFRGEIRLLRYEQWRNIGLLDILQEIQGYGYVYGTMFMPWDVGQRERSSAKTTQDIVEELGYEVYAVPRDKILNGIGRVREIFTQCYFDEIHCAEGIDCLENYRKKINTKNGEFMDAPHHDEYSHGADAFRYLCQAYDPTLREQFIANSSKLSNRVKSKVKRSV